MFSPSGRGGPSDPPRHEVGPERTTLSRTHDSRPIAVLFVSPLRSLPCGEDEVDVLVRGDGGDGRQGEVDPQVSFCSRDHAVHVGGVFVGLDPAEARASGEADGGGAEGAVGGGQLGSGGGADAEVLIVLGRGGGGGDGGEGGPDVEEVGPRGSEGLGVVVGPAAGDGAGHVELCLGEVALDGDGGRAHGLRAGAQVDGPHVQVDVARGYLDAAVHPGGDADEESGGGVGAEGGGVRLLGGSDHQARNDQRSGCQCGKQLLGYGAHGHVTSCLFLVVCIYDDFHHVPRVM